MMEDFVKYSSYSIDELASDMEFIKWVKFPDERNVAYWQAFLLEYPQQRSNVEIARKIIQDIRLKETSAGLGSKTAIWTRIEERIDGIRNIQSPVYRLRYWIAAASAVLILSVGYYLIPHKTSEKNVSAIIEQKTVIIAPGGNKAVLTLADGSTIVLDSANTGAISTQGNVTVIKLNEGELSYQSSGNTVTTEVQYNTISTPRGGQYQLTLSDGTKVWLNAESSLRYPAVFAGNERKVELTGEGYFEVAHNVSKPFFVKTASVGIKVLGTHFNVNAYDDEGGTKTTLLQGVVAVDANDKSVIIEPGQQAVFQVSNNILQTFNNVDIEQVVAWKNGYFAFRNTSLKDVMRQIGRWYNVDVEYEGAIGPRKFGGGIGRDAQLNDVLLILEESNVHFKLDGRKLIVKP